MMTVTYLNGEWYVISSDDGYVIPWSNIPHELYGALYKLHDYEKSGLTPDEVNRLAEAQP